MSTNRASMSAEETAYETANRITVDIERLIRKADFDSAQVAQWIEDAISKAALESQRAALAAKDAQPESSGSETPLTREHASQETGDAERLNYIEAFLRACPHGVIAYNDDPDVEADETENGFAPLGFRIAVEGCREFHLDVGDTLRAAIDSAMRKARSVDEQLKRLGSCEL